MSDKCPEFCPGCGSKKNLPDFPHWYLCGSSFYERLGDNNLIFRRSNKCYETQIAQLQAELASAREFIEEVVQIGRLMKNA